jgi:hypothetical protein
MRQPAENQRMDGIGASHCATRSRCSRSALPSHLRDRVAPVITCAPSRTERHAGSTPPRLCGDFPATETFQWASFADKVVSKAGPCRWVAVFLPR